MHKIKATCIKNPFQPRNAENRDEREFDFKGQTIGNVFCEYFPIPDPATRIVASVNGKVYEQADWKMELAPGDHLVFVPIPRGGGGGSNVMAMVAMIVIAIAAIYTGGAALGAMYGSAAMAGPVSATAYAGMQVAAYAITAAIMVGGGLLVSAIFPSNVAGISTDLSESSSTYGWSTQNNTAQEGTALPIIIGSRRVTPPLIAAHSEVKDEKSYLYLLFAVSEGPIENIYGIEIDEQPVGYYDNIDIHKRFGENSQTVIPYFNDVYSDTALNVLLNKDEYNGRQTSGNGIDAAQIHLTCPQGLWYASDSGKMQEQSVTVSIQYRKVGDSTWNNFYPLEDNDGWELYQSGKVYNPGEVVLQSGLYYKCKAYYARITPSVRNLDDSGPSSIAGDPYDGYTKTIKSTGFMGSRATAYPTPYPSNTNCWEPYFPGVRSLTITSSSNSAINRSYRIDFPERGDYEIQMKVVSGPPTDNQRYGGKIAWTGLTEIITDDISYPGVALLGMKIEATDQISGGIPKVTCIAEKNSHTFPIAGTVSLKNPAWASYFVLNNSIWGGGIPESNIKLIDFQEWAAYCDSKGLTCTMYVDQCMTYNDLKNYLCEIGRANIIQMGTKFGVVIDRPDVPTQLFTVANIIKDSFSMNYLPLDERANVIRANYYDKEQNWEKSTVEVRTNDYITAGQERAQEITLYACDRKDLAARHCRLLLNYNLALVRTCSFDVSIDALACTIGDIALVQHDVTRYGFGGRIIEDVDIGTPTKLKIDRPIPLDPGITYGVLIRDSETDDVKTYTFTVPSNGEYTEITTSVPMSPLPNRLDVYSIGQVNIEAKPFRIVSISRSEEFTRKITALEYNEDVYDDTHVVDETDNYMAPPIVSGLDVVEIIDNIFSNFTVARLTWRCPASYGVNISFTYVSNGTKITKFVGTFKTNNIEVNGLPVNVPVTFIASPVNNPSSKSTVTSTFYGEANSVYELGAYEFDVFASDKVHEKVGPKTPYSMWLQEPQSVSMTFLN